MFCLGVTAKPGGEGKVKAGLQKVKDTAKAGGQGLARAVQAGTQKLTGRKRTASDAGGEKKRRKGGEQ